MEILIVEFYKKKINKYKKYEIKINGNSSK